MNCASRRHRCHYHPHVDVDTTQQVKVCVLRAAVTDVSNEPPAHVPGSWILRGTRAWRDSELISGARVSVEVPMGYPLISPQNVSLH